MDVEKARERLVQQLLSDLDAMPPSRMHVPEVGSSYEEDARARILTEYCEADLRRLVELYNDRAQGKDEDERFDHALELFNGEKKGRPTT